MESCHPQQAWLSAYTVSTLLLVAGAPVCPLLVSRSVCLWCVHAGVLASVGNDFERRSDAPRNSQYHPISVDWNQHAAAAAAGVVFGQNVLPLQSFAAATSFLFFFSTIIIIFIFFGATCFLLGMCRVTADGRDLPQERLSLGLGVGGGVFSWLWSGRFFCALVR